MTLRLIVLIALLATACGGAAAPASTGTAAPSAVPASATVASNVRFNVRGDRSKATLRVREQLARVPAPSDAVLAVTGVTGSFMLMADGTFAPDSRITVDLTTIKSDQTQRDQFIKRDPLQVDRFPKAELLLQSTSGLVTPLPIAGDFAFKLTGRMTIHGVARVVTFDVQAKRAGAELTATAVNAPTWKFADFGMTAPSTNVVLSVIDEIRLSFDLVATEAK